MDKVPGGGVEPPHPKILDFESSASANSAIRAYLKIIFDISKNERIYFLSLQWFNGYSY